jgi:hypothetical protein
MRPVKTVPGIAGGEIKENDGVCEFKWYIVRTLVSVTMYPHCSNKTNKKDFKKGKTINYFIHIY